MLPSAIRFAVNLYEHSPDMSLSDAYVAACMQYRALRSEREVAKLVAIDEAEYYGTTFEPNHIDRSFEKEQEYLASWEGAKSAEAESMEGRKKWRMRVERPIHDPDLQPGWSRGEEYIRLWKKGVRPDYSPAVSAPLDQGSEVLVEYPENPDYMHVLQKA